MAIDFEPVMNANYRLAAAPPAKRIAIGGYSKVASYDMLGEQLHHSNRVKQESIWSLDVKYLNIKTLITLS